MIEFIFIERVSAYALLYFLPCAMESPNATGHFALTVVHQISIPLGQNISCDNPRNFLEVCLHVTHIRIIVTRYQLRPWSCLHNYILPPQLHNYAFIVHCRLKCLLMHHYSMRDLWWGKTRTLQYSCTCVLVCIYTVILPPKLTIKSKLVGNPKLATHRHNCGTTQLHATSLQPQGCGGRIIHSVFESSWPIF